MDASKTPNNHSTLEVDYDSRYVETQGQPPPQVDPMAMGYQDLPEVVATQVPGQYGGLRADVKLDNTPPEAVPKESPRICGLRRKMFFGLLIVAILVVIGTEVGVAVGVTTSKNKDDSPKENNNTTESGSGNGNESESKVIDGTLLYRNTRLSTLNFTDEYDNDNFIVLYQRQDRAIYMSTFNSSHGKWIVHPVVDGTTDIALEDIRLGTAISLDLYFYKSTERSFHLYWQTSKDYIRSMHRYMMATHEVSGPRDWRSPFTYDRYSSANGSSIVSHARACLDCLGTAYLFFQDNKSALSAAQLPGKNSEGWVDRPQPDATRPTANTSMALTYLPAPNGTKAIRIFYQAQSGVLNHFIYPGGDKAGWHASLPRGLSGNATIAAFATGFNQTKRNDLDPMGFQVLTTDQESKDGVLLTYYHDGSWTADDEVTALSECSARGVMVANAAGRVYCLVDADNGKVEIVEFAWKGDRSGDVDTFMRYDRIGTVNTGRD